MDNGSINLVGRQNCAAKIISASKLVEHQSVSFLAKLPMRIHALAAAVASVLTISVGVTPSVAQDAVSACDHTTHPHGCTDANDASAVAKELSNPAGSLASLTLKNQFRFYEGDLPDADNQWNYSALFQPTFPFPIASTPDGSKWNFFARPAVPLLVEQPTFGPAGFRSVTALGDIGFDTAVGVTRPDGWIAIAGMVGTLPTATDAKVAGKQLRLGPEVFVGKSFDWGLVGLFPSHQWNVAGWSDEQYSTTQIQPFVNINLSDGWQVSSQPIITYDWTDDQWTVPINAQIAKTVQIGKLPARFQLEADYYVEKNDAFANEWLVGINITPVVPNFINNWLRGN